MSHPEITNSVEMATPAHVSAARKKQQQLQKQKQHDAKINTEPTASPTYKEVIGLLARSGLPPNLLNRLLQDVNGYPHYERVSCIDDIDVVQPNSSYVGNICTGFACNTGFLVRQGELGKGQIDDSFVWFGPGFHKINNFGSKFSGCVSTTQTNVAHTNGSSGFVVISDGNIGILMVGASFKLLCPGVFSWNSPSTKFIATANISQNVARLGPFTFLQIPSSLCAVTYQNGDLRILGWTSEQDAENESKSNNKNNGLPQQDLVVGGMMHQRAYSSATPQEQQGCATITSVKDLEAAMNNSDTFHLIGASDSERERNNSKNIQQQNGNNSAPSSVNASFDGKNPQQLQVSILEQQIALKNQINKNNNSNQQEGEEHEVMMRNYFLDDALWTHSTFLSLKTQTDRLDDNTGLLTKDNIEMSLVAMSQWRISNPVLAIKECSDSMEGIRSEVNNLVRATIARIIASTTIANGGSTAGVVNRDSRSPMKSPPHLMNPLRKNPHFNNNNNPKNDDDDDTSGIHSPQELHRTSKQNDSVDSFFLPTTPQGGKQGGKAPIILDDSPVKKSSTKTNNEKKDEADLSKLMSSETAQIHMRDLTRNLAAMGVEILGVFVPERRMKNDDIRHEVARQAVIGIQAEAQRAAADAQAYATVTLARAEAEAISEVAKAHAEAGKKLGDPDSTAARLALSEVVAKTFKDAKITMFSGMPQGNNNFMMGGAGNNNSNSNQKQLQSNGKGRVQEIQ